HLGTRLAGILGKRIVMLDEARGVGAGGGSHTNQRKNGNPRPGTRAKRHVGARHRVTHWYAKSFECALKQRPVNKVLRINFSFQRQKRTDKNVTACQSSRACPGSNGTKRTAMRSSRVIS